MGLGIAVRVILLIFWFNFIEIIRLLFMGILLVFGDVYIFLCFDVWFMVFLSLGDR